MPINFDQIFSDFNNLKVLIIGDVMIDSYLWGSVNRISPEAPVPIINVEKREYRLGGAANVALNVQALGATPILCSVIGDDLDGDRLYQLVQDQNMPIGGLVKSNERVTTIKHRIISGHQHMLRVDSEVDNPLNSNEEKLLESKIDDLIKSVDVVIFEDYDKGAITEQIITSTVDKANKAGVPTTVDPKKRNFESYKKVSLFKPNLKELKEGLKVDIDEFSSEIVENAIDQLAHKLQSESIMVTLSEHGVMIKSNKGTCEHFPAFKRDISDVSGAGDTVISVASLCKALKLENKTIASLANLAGGLVCEHVGVVPINKQALLKEAKVKL